MCLVYCVVTVGDGREEEQVAGHVQGCSVGSATGREHDVYRTEGTAWLRTGRHRHTQPLPSCNRFSRSFSLTLHGGSIKSRNTQQLSFRQWATLQCNISVNSFGSPLAQDLWSGTNISGMNSFCALQQYSHGVRQWLCGRVSGLQSGGCGFESRPGLLRTEVCSAFHPSGVGIHYLRQGGCVFIGVRYY